MWKAAILIFFISTLSTEAFIREFAFIGEGRNWKYNGAVKVINKEDGNIKAHVLIEDGNTGHVKFIVYNNGEAFEVHNSTEIICIPSVSVPPLDELLNSLDKMEEINKGVIKKNIADQCSNEKLYKIVFTGTSYIVCLNNNTINIYGEEFKASLFEQEYKHPAYTKSCNPSTYRNKVSHALERKLVSDKWWKRSYQKTLTVNKVCLFVHGSGQSGFGNPSDTFTDYWGDVHYYATQCASHKFIHIDTLEYGWDSEILQQKFCEFATLDQTFDKHFIQNKIIFSHSMGNLIIAGAIFNKTCELDLNSTSWYSLSKPANGSAIAKDLVTVCSSTGVEAYVATLEGACTRRGTPSNAYMTLLPGNPKFRMVLPIMTNLIKGAMCGTSPTGLNSMYSIGLDILSKIANLEVPNDGMVWLWSCHILRMNSTLESDPSDLFYTADINHADATCRNGNGLWGVTRRPCDWFHNKI